jgi:hypothetical protein
MNGVEFGEYVFPGIHTFSGLVPGGADTAGDPRFIDPWWRQRFDEHVVHTWRDEQLKLIGEASSLALLFTIAFSIAGSNPLLWSAASEGLALFSSTIEYAAGTVNANPIFFRIGLDSGGYTLSRYVSPYVSESTEFQDEGNNPVIERLINRLKGGTTGALPFVTSLERWV